jgi:hypothetical protein
LLSRGGAAPRASRGEKYCDTMSLADEEIRSLAAEVARSFEAQADAPKPSSKSFLQNQLPSSITLYRTGRVLYSCHSRSSDDVRVVALIDAFDIMMATLPRKYVHSVLLHNLHLSYASMVASFATSEHSPPSPAISSIRSMIAKSHPTVSIISWNDIIEATESLCGIYISSVNACQCCCLTIPPEEGRYELELAFVSLSWVYDYVSNKKGGGDAPGGDPMKKSILRTLSSMLLYGIVISSGKSEEDTDDQLSSIMTVIQNIQSLLGEYNCALGDMLDLENEFQATLSSKFHAKGASPPPQLQYLLAMLRSSPRSKVPQPCIVESAPILEVKSTSQPKPESLTEVQIDHIRSVLPALGEGYIEEALKCYSHDVERTLEALLDMSDGGNRNEIHPRLLTIPANLPRKLRDRVDRYSANVNLHRGSTAKDDGKEHAKIQKEHIKYVERKAEEEAFLIENVSRNLGGLSVSDEAADNDRVRSMRDEYDDDYDDQYDGIGDDGGIAGGIGGLDEGLYDVDIHNVHQKYDRGGAKNEQEMWRKYNTIIKDIDAESRFWDSNRNSNRAGGKHGKAKADNEQDNELEDGGDGTKYRGLDKGKGGRLIGPDGKYLPVKRGGQKGRGGTVGGTGSNPARGAGRGGRGGSGGRGGDSDSKGDHNTNQNKEGDGDLSKLQKRRKNDNKSKIGNHHRKDRASKKAAGGMVI